MKKGFRFILPTVALLGSFLFYNWFGGLAKHQPNFLLYPISRGVQLFSSLDFLFLADTPYTSYIVLETKEQEDAMLRRQKEYLNASSKGEFGKQNPEWDIDESPVPASEPSLVVSVAIVLVLGVFYRRYKKRMTV